MPARCFICQGASFHQLTPQYRRCRECGHETLLAGETQAYMLNDPLSASDARRVSWLDRFQDSVLDRWGGAAAGGQWVDIGSGSGKLLARNRARFARHCGVEITPAAVAFATGALGLDIVTDISLVTGGIDFATAWHSLEHFPTPALESLLAHLSAKMPAGARFVVSVPNGASWQYRLFRERYAFFDVPNHLQQFTPDSLGRLLAAHGFTCTGSVVSWPYNVFGHVQGLLNFAVRGHNHLYYRLKRRTPAKSGWQDLASLALLPVALPIGAGLSLLDATDPAKQAVLTCCFERTDRPPVFSRPTAPACIP